MRLLIVLLALAGCGDTEVGGGAPAVAPREAPRQEGVDCGRDEDCVLLPVVTCCGECPPAPPFEAITREALDAVLIENEWKCGAHPRACDARACEPRPRGCYARAACVGSRCVVESEGCGG